jgi:hypothetical protein
MNKQTCGTCGNCGGRVTVDTIYYSTIPPRPQCEWCFAYAAEDNGPVIPMEASPNRVASNKWFDITTNFNTVRFNLVTSESIARNAFTIYQTK